MEFDTRNYVFVCFSISLQRFILFFSSPETRHPKVSFDFKRFSLSVVLCFRLRLTDDNLWRQVETGDNSFVSCRFFFFSFYYYFIFPPLPFDFLPPKTEPDRVNLPRRKTLGGIDVHTYLYTRIRVMDGPLE